MTKVLLAIGILFLMCGVSVPTFGIGASLLAGAVSALRRSRDLDTFLKIASALVPVPVLANSGRFSLLESLFICVMLALIFYPVGKRLALKYLAPGSRRRGSRPTRRRRP